MAGIQLIGLGENLTTSTESWDPDFDSFYCDMEQTQTTEQNKQKVNSVQLDSNNEMKLLSHIVKEIDNDNEQRLNTKEAVELEENKKVPIVKESSKINNSRKKVTKKVSFMLPTTDHAITSEPHLEYESGLHQEKKSDMPMTISENNSEDSSKETSLNNESVAKLVEEKMISKNDKCTCCTRNSSNMFKVPELTEMLQNLQLECCQNCNPNKIILSKVYKENLIGTKNNNGPCRQSLLNTGETVIISSNDRKKNQIKEETKYSEEKTKTVISERKVYKRTSIKSADRKSNIGKNDSDLRTNKPDSIKEAGSEDIAKCIPLDHHLKCSNNPKLLCWLKEKNKDFKKKRLEERKQKREERKIKKRNEQEQMEKKIISDNKVNEWMRLKRLARRTNSKVVPGNDANVVENSTHERKIPDGYLEVRTFSPAKLVFRAESAESGLKYKKGLKSKKSSKSKDLVFVKKSKKQTKCEKLNEINNENHSEKKRKSYTEWLTKKRNETAKTMLIMKKKDSDDKIEINLLASERRRRFKEVQESTSRVDSGLKKAKSNSTQSLVELSKIDSIDNDMQSKLNNKFKFKSKQAIENELKLRPEPQGCDSSSCMDSINEDGSNVVEKKINKKDELSELTKITNMKAISHRPTTSLEYINEDLSRPWMVDNEDHIREE